MAISSNISPDFPNQPAKKFYFLEYFYVLLKSIENSPRLDRAFEFFLELKQQHRLGDSRYKKLTGDIETSSPAARVKFEYTFQRVLGETEEYGLVIVNDKIASITPDGRRGIDIYEESGPIQFNQFLFCFMEDKYQAFRYILEACYKANPQKSGLLILPIYSPNRLGIERGTLKTSGDLQNYFHVLKQRLVADIKKHLGEKKDLDDKNVALINALIDAGLLSRNPRESFDSKKYNVILKRGRDYWLKFFLQDLYNYPASLTTFDTWAYRGKQIGVLHITEFYPDPNFGGRIVYPLSVITKDKKGYNFIELYTYVDSNKLYLHQPSWEYESNREEFVKYLHQAYIDIRLTARNYFVNLASVRERVCYNLKIPEFLFDAFLGNVYHQQQNLRIRISLEVDKLPEETNVMYLRREPVMVDGKYRNIIAIDLA